MARLKAAKFVLTSLFLASALSFTGGVLAKGPAEAATKSNETSIRLGELPRQGQETYELIHRGGPFPHEKDGTVFGNRERSLPPQKRGFYREYTVRTPGSRDRGARRIVCGGPATTPEACFYTADHYASFRKIVE